MNVGDPVRALLALIVSVVVMAPALAEPRVALVIGNGAYDANTGRLLNPVGDAQAVAGTLKKVGFDVELVTDADQKTMKRAIIHLGQRLRAAGAAATGLFYYGGHGLQANGENYLIPLGARIEAEADTEIEAVSVKGVLAQMDSAGGAVHIVILDACRNTPVLRSRGGQRGLVRMDAPTGSFVAYSTAPGETAEDGNPGAHSPFAAALVSQLAKPVPIDELFTGVRRQVWTATRQKQTPWTSSSLMNAFYFAPKAATGAGKPADPAMELALWNSVKDSGDAVALQSYLDTYPTGTFAAAAMAALKKLQPEGGTAPATGADVQLASVAPDTPSVRTVDPYSTLLVLSGHTSPVYSAAFSPDGGRIVTASWDNTARIWDANKGVQRVLMRGHTNNIWSAAFSPDGTRVVTASDDRTARVWDAETGAQLLSLSGHKAEVLSAVFSPDGKKILTASVDKTVRVWDAKTGAQIAELKGHAQYVKTAVFSPDGARILTASVDHTARIWNADTGAEIAVLQHNDVVDCAAFSADGKRIVTGSDDLTARVWDAASGVQQVVLQGHAQGVTSVAFSPDSAHIVTASYDHTARVWDAKSGEQVAVLAHNDMVLSAAYSPDGARIVTAVEDLTARIWDGGTDTIPARDP